MEKVIRVKDKKEYPSQLNTKSIACRLPISNYVEIFEECLKKGISMNDWLLIKIFGKGENKSENNTLKISVKGIINHLDPDDDNYHHQCKIISDYFYAMDLDNVELELKDLESLLMEFIFMRNNYLNLRKAKQQASIEDVKNQLTILINNKFSDLNDRKEFRKDILPLLKELE
jgi:hypothetical protein